MKRSRPPIRRSGAALALVLLAHCGAPQEQQSDVVARVDGQPVTLTELNAFSASIPDGMKKGASLLEKERQVLESLIDMRLLLLEASSLPLDEDRAFQDELGTFERDRLVELYTKRAIVDQVSISDEEMEEQFLATNRNRALRFSGVMLKTREEAEELRREAENGADFMKLAMGRSLHRESGEQGGDIGRYQLKDEVLPAIAEAIFSLPVGGISEPVSLPFENRPHFAVFQVTDETSVPLETAERKVRQEVFRRKRLERYQVLYDSLTAEYQPKLEQEQIAWLSGFSDPSSDGPLYPPADMADKPICSFRDGMISVGEFLRDARSIRISQRELADGERVSALITESVLTPHLFAAEGAKAGLDSHPGLLERVEQKRQNMLLNALRDSQVDQGIDASEEEARAFFDANPEKFKTALTTEILEVLTASDTLAAQIKAAMLSGTDAEVESLAVAHTLRYGASHHGGRLSINLYSKAYYKDISEAAESAEVGQIVGPQKVPQGYSVFKVLDRHQSQKPYDENSRKRSIAYVKIDKSKHSYVRYVRGLREKYPVEIFDEVLAGAAQPAE